MMTAAVRLLARVAAAASVVVFLAGSVGCGNSSPTEPSAVQTPTPMANVSTFEARDAVTGSMFLTGILTFLGSPNRTVPIPPNGVYSELFAPGTYRVTIATPGWVTLEGATFGVRPYPETKNFVFFLSHVH